MNKNERYRTTREINGFIKSAKDGMKTYPPSSVSDIGIALEKSIKLYYGITSNNSNLGDLITQLEKDNTFNYLIISDMRVIQTLYNAVKHSVKVKNIAPEDITEEYANDLLYRLKKCIWAIEKKSGLKILDEPKNNTKIKATAPNGITVKTIKLGDEFKFHSNCELLNFLFNMDFPCWNACTCKVNDSEIIWMIALTGKESDYGWTNTLEPDGNTITEEYTGDPRTRLERHLYIDKTVNKIVFDIEENAYHERKYIFRGIFKFDYEKGNDDRRIWNKFSDEFVIDSSLQATNY